MNRICISTQYIDSYVENQRKRARREQRSLSSNQNPIRFFCKTIASAFNVYNKSREKHDGYGNLAFRNSSGREAKLQGARDYIIRIANIRVNHICTTNRTRALRQGVQQTRPVTKGVLTLIVIPYLYMFSALLRRRRLHHRPVDLTVINLGSDRVVCIYCTTAVPRRIQPCDIICLQRPSPFFVGLKVSSLLQPCIAFEWDLCTCVYREYDKVSRFTSHFKVIAKRLNVYIFFHPSIIISQNNRHNKIGCALQ